MLESLKEAMLRIISRTTTVLPRQKEPFVDGGETKNDDSFGRRNVNEEERVKDC